MEKLASFNDILIKTITRGTIYFLKSSPLATQCLFELFLDQYSDNFKSVFTISIISVRKTILLSNKRYNGKVTLFYVKRFMWLKYSFNFYN